MTSTQGPSQSDDDIRRLEVRLADLASQQSALALEIEALRRSRRVGASSTGPEAAQQGVLSAEAKMALFRSMFRGREDVYARRWENRTTGKSGYSPVCEGGWQAYKKDPSERVYLPLTDDVVRCHLRGFDPREPQGREYIVGVYPLLTDENCWFLAADFDNESWTEDASEFLETCRSNQVSAALERSRSGNGGHVWIFFAEPVPAILARKLGAFLLTMTMERRPEIGLESYDRFFPNQDTMPAGGFGNLIALPLQRKAREEGNSVFLDEELKPHPDQMSFLTSLRPMTLASVTEIVENAQHFGRIVGVRMVATEEDDDEPWTLPPSRRRPELVLTDSMPANVQLVVGNQVYVPKEGLPPALRNRLIRIAAFQNPEFYKAQAMRFSTFGKPRVVACAEDFSQHIGLPRGCLDDILDLFASVGTRGDIVDQRTAGTGLSLTFHGALRPDQDEAFGELRRHDTGVLAATTAFGKTVVAARLIAERGLNALVLVHRRQLLDQWVERLGEFLELDRKQIGQFGAGKRKLTGLLDVALIQSLCRKGVVQDFVGEYGHLVVDECHHLSAQSFEQVARAFKGRYVLGLSATPIRKDGHHPIIFMQCGPIRYRVDARKQAAERPFEHRVIVRRTAWRWSKPDAPEARPTIQEIYAAIVGDEARNEQIIEDARQALAAGRSPVVLTERRDHLDLLAERLSPFCRNVVVLRGGMGAKQRRAIAEELAAIPDGEERLLLSTGRYLGEGFDDKRLDTLFLTMPISWRGTLAQYAGRLHRLHDLKKKVIIYDYADVEEPMLARMHEKRLRGYTAIGYTIDMERAAG